MKRILGGCVAEFVGTFALMFVGGAAIVLTTGGTGGGLVGIALAHGLILACVVSATMHISGGQINPAVSIALLSIGKQGPAKTGLFIVSQMAGATLGAFLLRIGFDSVVLADGTSAAEACNLGATLPANPEAVSLTALLILEVAATFLLMFSILGSAVDPRGVGKGPMVGGFAIGLTVAALILAIGPVTGASMNPARSFGPQILAENAGWNWWAYYVAPLVGAVLAAQVWNAFIGFGKDEA